MSTNKSRRSVVISILGLTAAACIALLIFIKPFGSSLDPNTHAANFEDYQWSSQQRSGDDQALANVQAFYKDKDYATVLAEIQSNFSDSKDPMLTIAKGVSHMRLNQHEAAIASFQKIIDAGRIDFADHAYWYIALSQIKLDNLPAAKSALQKIMDSKRSKYKDRAQELIKKL